MHDVTILLKTIKFFPDWQFFINFPDFPNFLVSGHPVYEYLQKTWT